MNARDTREVSLITGWGRDPLEKELAIHQYFSLKIPSTESLLCYSPWGYRESDTTEHKHTHTSLEIVSLITQIS